MVGIPAPKIIRSRRMSLSMRIDRNGQLIVNAPVFAPQFIIDQFLNAHTDWITKTFAKVNLRKPKKRKYVEGEEFWYLGEKYNLKFYSGVKILYKNNTLFFPKALEFRIQKELDAWYKKEAREKITERVIHHAREMGAYYAELMFSDTKSKWGTCFHDNSLQFNWRLIMAPLMVLDYVVIHELTHTTEKNHGTDFWRKVTRFTPAWKQHRKWLNIYGPLLTI